MISSFDIVKKKHYGPKIRLNSQSRAEKRRIKSHLKKSTTNRMIQIVSLLESLFTAEYLIQQSCIHAIRFDRNHKLGQLNLYT